MNDKDDVTTSRHAAPVPRFGDLLRALREAYPERVGRKRPGTAVGHMKLSAVGLIRCMERHGYVISPAAFSEIENNESIPKEPKGFLDAVVACLELSDDEIRDLTDILIHDIIRSKLGEEITQRHYQLPQNFGHYPLEPGRRSS
jgi:hypothetical protein